MPRTIEGIVAAHDAATARRRAGLPVWAHKIKIKHLLETDDFSPENVASIGQQIATILRDSTWVRAAGEDPSIQSVIDEFSDVDDLEQFNWIIDELYDLADADRVWVG